jgi:hypothetical protein
MKALTYSITLMENTIKAANIAGKRIAMPYFTAAKLGNTDTC